MALKKFEEKKKLRIFKKMLFLEKDFLNADKRQQLAKTIISICSHCSKSHAVYKDLKLFADLQGPICYKDP